MEGMALKKPVNSEPHPLSRPIFFYCLKGIGRAAWIKTA